MLYDRVSFIHKILHPTSFSNFLLSLHGSFAIITIHVTGCAVFKKLSPHMLIWLLIVYVVNSPSLFLAKEYTSTNDARGQCNFWNLTGHLQVQSYHILLYHVFTVPWNVHGVQVTRLWKKTSFFGPLTHLTPGMKKKILQPYLTCTRHNQSYPKVLWQVMPIICKYS